MTDYIQVVRTLSPPSFEQVKSFVDYVAGAHSWYKHLPPVPPGAPFYFFLDPNAGLDMVLGIGGTRYRYREKKGFHYSDIPTAEYRQRFGALQYATGAGTSFLVPRLKGALWISSARRPASVSPADRTWGRFKARLLSLIGLGGLDALLNAVESERSQVPTIHSAEHGQISVPDEILEAGRVRLTGIIHPIASSDWFWKWQDARVASSRWPAETGGPETVLKILDLIRGKPRLESWGLQTVEGGPVLGFHPEIHNLVDPERRRLKKLMEEAIHRVTHRVYG